MLPNEVLEIRLWDIVDHLNRLTSAVQQEMRVDGSSDEAHLWSIIQYLGVHPLIRKDANLLPTEVGKEVDPVRIISSSSRSA